MDPVTAQAVHAAFLFATEFPEVTEAWHRESNFVVVLQVPDEAALIDRFHRLVPTTDRVVVTEPDLNDEATAFAVVGPIAGRLLSDLPLCQKVVAMMA